MINLKAITLHCYILFTLIIISGCAASGPVFSEKQIISQPGTGTIIAYNSDRGILNVILNNHQIGLLRHGGFLTHSTEPGIYTIQPQRRNAIPIKVHIIEESVTYLKLNLRAKTTEYISTCSENEDTIVVCRKIFFQASFDVIPEKIALTELSRLKQSQQ